MALGNNLSLLPWYSDKNNQNHRRSSADIGVCPLITPTGHVPPFQLIIPNTIGSPFPYAIITHVYIHAIDETVPPALNHNLLNAWLARGLRLEHKQDYVILINDGLQKIIDSTAIPEGQFYLTIQFTKATEDYVIHSEVFNFVDSVSHCLKLEYWDNQDFPLSTKYVIDYSENYKNFLYLPVEIGMPEYPFEEEVTKRDGFSFIEKQISEKKYKFVFVAPEYLCDAIRIIRMHDNVVITTQEGIVFEADTILLTPKWLPGGYLATVEAEFECNTVIKKIGAMMSPTAHRDYSTDFNSDFS